MTPYIRGPKEGVGGEGSGSSTRLRMVAWSTGNLFCICVPNNQRVNIIILMGQEVAEINDPDHLWDFSRKGRIMSVQTVHGLANPVKVAFYCILGPDGPEGLGGSRCSSS